MFKSLKNKKIILGITGGIAAYKCHELIRLLTAKGAIVKIVLTKSAESFISPLSLQALANDKLYKHDFFDYESESAMEHIDLARWADLILIAPATANSIAKLAAGFADDLLSTLILATTAKLAIAPAMNQQMWQNSITLENVERLRSRSFEIFGPGHGAQACGEFGPGRMLEPHEIIDLIETNEGICESVLHNDLKDGSIDNASRVKFDVIDKPLLNKKIVITAGPTREAIDPVRYISNHSSGKMGYALAEVAVNLGAEVTLVSGPTNLIAPIGSKVVNVVSAMDMLDAVMSNINNADIFIGTAAVSDYRLSSVVSEKIKKSGDSLNIELVPNPDILFEVSKLENKPFLIGFAAETNNILENAKLKLKKKNLDMIIANDVSSGKVFGSDNNTAVIINKNGNKLNYNNVSKLELAEKILISMSF